jgi:hypothetical protein
MVAEVEAPERLWRVHRGADPLYVRRPRASTRSDPGAGNRFDSPDGSYGVLYFGSSLIGCLGEVLARLRPKPALAALVADDWAEMGVMGPGQVPRDWRERRSAAQVSLPDSLPFVDVDASATHQLLRTELALGLSSLGYQDLDISTVRGPDRRLTQMISQWAYMAGLEDDMPRYAGLRYKSRVDDAWECWAIFDEAPIQAEEIRPVTLSMPEFQHAASMLDLTVH